MLLVHPFFFPVGMREHPPVSVCALADHIERLKANDSLRFSQEYEVTRPKSRQMRYAEENCPPSLPSVKATEG